MFGAYDLKYAQGEVTDKLNYLSNSSNKTLN